jgi:DnaJ-class molecular chaperone
MTNNRMICPKCGGNGFIKSHWEAEEVIVQCKTCESSGELSPTKHYGQTWTEPNGNKALYFGPLLDPDEFKDWTLD